MRALPARLLFLAFSAALLGACGGDVHPMTRAPSTPARREYRERTTATATDVLGGLAFGVRGGEATGLGEESGEVELDEEERLTGPAEPAPPPVPTTAAEMPSPADEGAHEYASDAYDLDVEAAAGGAGGGAAAGDSMGADALREVPIVESRSVLESTAGTTGTGAASRLLNVGGWASVEPLPWVPLDPAPVPLGPRRILLASLELPPGEAVRPPSSACQDVLLYVEDGVLEAIGTGIGTTDSPATLYGGDAVRFGAEGDARIENTGTEPVRAMLAIARREGTGAPLYTSYDDADRCPLPAAPDPLVRPMRIAHEATAAPLSALDDHLEVRILLDADGAGAEHAGLAVLRGDAETHVPEHVHERSAELLYVLDGEGTMTLGERELAVHPGIVVYVPEGTRHAFSSSGRRPLVALQVYSPSGPEQRFRTGAPAR